MIIADVLTDMSTLNNELDVSAGGAQEQQAINAVKAAIRYFLTVAASLPRVLSSFPGPPLQGQSSAPPIGPYIVTAPNIESSPIPNELLRIDRIWALDPNTNIPIFPLKRLHGVGDHTPALPWPLNYVVAPANGQPRAYYPDGSTLYWLPIPDNVYRLRAYGLWSPLPIQDRKSVFPFPDTCVFPIAAFATKYTLVSVNDAPDEVQKIAVEAFTPLLRSLRRRDRSGPMPRHYEYIHTT